MIWELMAVPWEIGNNKNNIFHCEEDFLKYLELMKENKEKNELKIYHYTLMNNHIHKIIKSKDGEKLSKAIKRINISYVNYYRKKYKGIGHFFQDRYKSFIIEEGRYLLECGRYVELNPVRAGLVKRPEEYKWTSYRVYAKGEGDEIVDLNPEYEGLSEDKESRRRIYQQYIMEGIKERREEDRFFKEGVYGSKEYIEELKKIGLKTIWSHKGRPKKERMISNEK